MTTEDARAYYLTRKAEMMANGVRDQVFIINTVIKELATQHGFATLLGNRMVAGISVDEEGIVYHIR